VNSFVSLKKVAFDCLYQSRVSHTFDQQQSIMAEMFPNAAAGMRGGPGAADTQDDGKLVDLRSKIDNGESYARNEASGYPMSNLFIGDSRLGCKSDADEQIIIHISFKEFVKVRHVVHILVERPFLMMTNELLTTRCMVIL
jgi:hypothetical protein